MADWFELGVTALPNTRISEELLLDDFYTIKVRFPNNNKLYTYKVDKQLVVNEEDQVIVNTSTGLQIVTVAKVDEIPDIDFNSTIVYKYIVDRVNKELYEELLERSEKIKLTITQVGRQQMRRALLSELKGSLTAEGIKMIESNLGISLEDEEVTNGK